MLPGLPFLHSHIGGTHIAFSGDSFIGEATTKDSGSRFVSAFINAGNVALLNVLTNQCWHFDYMLDNFAKGGGTSADMLATLQMLINRRPDIAFLQGGHNDVIANGIAYMPTLFENWNSTITQLLSAGIKVVLVLNPPLNSAPDQSTISVNEVRKSNLWLNQWKRQTSEARSNVYCWDWNVAIVDPHDPGGSALKALVDQSGIHPNYLGNHMIAQRGLIDLAPLIGGPTAFCSKNRNDVYDEVYNPLGNLVANSQFLGAAGILNGFEGVVPDGWSMKIDQRGIGKTHEVTLTPREDGFGNNLHMSVSGLAKDGGSNEAISLTTILPLQTNLAAGSVVEGMVEVWVDRDSPFNNVYARLGVVGGDAWGNWWGPPISGASATDWTPGPSFPWSGTIRIPPLRIPTANYTGLFLFLQAQYNDVDGTFRGGVSFGAPTLRLCPGLT
jgi:lysophospholipase L1-like esterase